MVEARYEIITGKNDQFYFRPKSKGNSQIILQSEGYTSKQGCIGGIASCQKNSGDDDSYDRKEAKNGQFYFNLVAKNGEVIGTSEMYTTTAARDNGIEAVKRDGGTNNIVDNS